ncbi:MAG TPA: GGDEF domain-containing protein [Baekduia sp.]|nr:GGDEF domain-containing protein [Baekduia sp.]
MAAQLKRAAHARNCAAAHRDAAALDREEAARDRDQSAHDREQAARELERESVDHLTGALGRRAGLIAIQRELDRTARSGEPIVVAFVDVDDLKAINDTQGHPAGDKALRGVARCIKGNLRSYDVVMRFGGDEFVCSLAGQDLEAIRARFERIAAELTDAPGSHRISVGLTQRQAHETLDELIARADEALLATRRLRREPGRTEERSD